MRGINKNKAPGCRYQARVPEAGQGWVGLGRFVGMKRAPYGFVFLRLFTGYQGLNHYQSFLYFVHI